MKHVPSKNMKMSTLPGLTKTTTLILKPREYSKDRTRGTLQFQDVFLCSCVRESVVLVVQIGGSGQVRESCFARAVAFVRTSCPLLFWVGRQQVARPPAAKESSGPPPFGCCWIGSGWIGVGGAALCVGALLSSLDSRFYCRFWVASESGPVWKDKPKGWNFPFFFLLPTKMDLFFYLDIYKQGEWADFLVIILIYFD